MSNFAAGGVSIALKLQMLGTGNAFAKTFFNNNALLTIDGRTLLVDCGITAPLSLYTVGKSFNDLDAVLVTHIHGDHVGGLEEYAFQMKFLYGRKPVLFIADTLADALWDNTLKGGLAQDDTQSLEDFFEVRLLTEGVPSELLPGITAELIKTEHIPGKKSYSVLFNDFFFYSGDMVYNLELLQTLVENRGVDLVFHDCQIRPPGVVHACLPQLLTLPEHIQKRVCLMHYGDDQPEFEGLTGFMRFVRQHKVYELEPGAWAEQFQTE